MTSLVLVSLIFFSMESWAEEKICSVDLFPKIVFLKKASDTSQIQDVIKSSNCAQGDLWRIFDTLQRVEGRISLAHINRLMQEDGYQGEVLLRPDSLEVIHVDKMVANHISSDRSLDIDEVKVVDPIYAIGVEELPEIHLECHACNSSGTKNLNIFYNKPNSHYKRNIWARVKISKLKRIVIATSDIHPFSNKDLKDYVEIRPFKVEKNERYVDSISNISYFKVNKYIKEGVPIRYSDLVAKKLVVAGRTTQVILEQEGFKLQVEAISRQSGKYGDFVSLYNPKSKKQIRGQVIDFNKVRVDI